MKSVNEVVLDYEKSENSEIGADLEQDGFILFEALGHCPCRGCNLSSCE